MFGLVGSPFREVGLAELRRLLTDPDYPVSSTFLYALTVLMRGGATTPQGRLEEDRRNREVIQGELLAAVPQKRGKALALTLSTTLEAGGMSQRPDGQTAARVAELFDQLPTDKQAGILEGRRDLTGAPAFLPVLRRYALRYREFTVPNEWDAYNSLRVSGAALRRWYELNPEEARPFVIQEVTRPRPRYGAAVPGMLPDETLPEVEQALAEHFAAEPTSYAAANLASLLQRYATAAVLPQVLPVVDEHAGKWACAAQAPALAYLLRVDPAAEGPLWERLTEWSEKWRDRERELRDVPGASDDKVWHRNLGSNLIQALAEGKSWLADEEKLGRLRQLAVGQELRGQVDTILSNWEPGRRSISCYRFGDRLHFRVLQYEADSLKGLEEKLAQFPSGSEFNWGDCAPPGDGDQVRKDVTELLTRRGMKLNMRRK